MHLIVTFVHNVPQSSRQKETTSGASPRRLKKGYRQPVLFNHSNTHRFFFFSAPEITLAKSEKGLYKIGKDYLDKKAVMRVDFRTRKLAKDCDNDQSRKRAFGMTRAKKIQMRLSSLLAATSLEDLRNAPGHFHELTGDRKGQFASDLDGPHRLVFEPVLTEEQRKIHMDGFVWSRITHIQVMSIEDYHG